MISLNTQAIEKQNITDGKILEVNSIFPTIQGEGPNTGTPAVFIRLAGCNLQCPNCDTEYTTRKEMAIEEIVKDVISSKSNGTTLVVITGGEPFRQYLKPLVENIFAQNFSVQIESNGILDPNFSLNVGCADYEIVVSPKTSQILPCFTGVDRSRTIPYYKYILNHKFVNIENGLPTQSLGKGKVWYPDFRIVPRSRVFLQPEDMKDAVENGRNTAACIQSCLEFGYRLSLQTHKMLGLP